MNSLLSVYDILLPPLYLIIALGYGYVVTKRNIRERPEYEYFFKGLLVRIIGSISLGLVYFFYYSGGDTTNYFQTASAYANLFSENETDLISPDDKIFISAMFLPNTNFFDNIFISFPW